MTFQNMHNVLPLFPEFVFPMCDCEYRAEPQDPLSIHEWPLVRGFMAIWSLKIAAAGRVREVAVGEG